MENQHNKKPDSALLSLRDEINEIDDQLIQLLGKRMEVVNKVGELKRSNHETFFIKSNREADMIKDLIKKSDSNFPKSAIINIWRKIITAANMHEQPLHIAIHNPNDVPDYAYLIREYYNIEVPISLHDSVTNIVLAMERGEAQIGIFALPKSNQRDIVNASENWWINLANNKLGIKIYAKIPFVDLGNKSRMSDEIELVAVAIKEAEESYEDNSLLYVEVDKMISESKVLAILKENNLDAKVLKSVKSAQVEDVIFYLIELNGFYTQEHSDLESFSKSKIRPFVKVLGSYALPIKI